MLKQLLPSGFKNVSAVRSVAMGKIKSKNNRTTELRLRMALIREGYSGWVLHPDLPGRPDFFFTREKLAVFVDGCFWHGCKMCGHVPKTRSRFWSAKIDRNRQRDRHTTRILKSSGIRVLRIWEHSLSSSDSLQKMVTNIGRVCEALSTGTRAKSSILRAPMGVFKELTKAGILAHGEVQ